MHIHLPRFLLFSEQTICVKEMATYEMYIHFPRNTIRINDIRR